MKHITHVICRPDPFALRKGCRASKTEKVCPNYSYSLGRCTLGKVKAMCLLVQQPKQGTKAARQAEFVREFYT